MKKLRDGMWSFGILYWISIIIAQYFEFLANGNLSGISLGHGFTGFLLFVGWIYLKPAPNLEQEGLSTSDISALKYYKLDSAVPPHEAYLHKTEIRMLQLEKYHLISQEYVLQVPYLCQIYHLLNLKHLESIHSFSLQGLKILDVSQLESTASGGAVRFQTVLDSSLNLLRIWRQPVVEVELVLHTPYTIELSIPSYGSTNITVMFNVLPLSRNNHKLFIDIYSDVLLPKTLVRPLLHIASSLTLLEDLPYLRKLTESKICRSSNTMKGSRPETMQLFERFTDLYGSSLEQPPSRGAMELQPVRAIASVG